MEHEILYKGAFAMGKVLLQPNESLQAESDAMVACSPNVKIEGKMQGGLLGALARKVFSGESFFFQIMTAQAGPGEVYFSPANLGDVSAFSLGNQKMRLRSGAFLAAESHVQINTKMQRLGAGIFSGAGLFILEVTGPGLLFISSYGAMHPITIPPGGEYIIDTGHLVAWEDSLQYEVTKASAGLMNSLTSGEMAVCRFRGPGTVYIQSRNISNLVTPSNS